MSWAGLKKAASRAGTQVSMKLGQVERTDDSAFKVEEERFKVLDKQANTLQKEAKAYLDAVRSVSASSTRIGNTLDLFFGTDSGEQAISANAYKRAVEELEGDIARTIVRTPCSLPGRATPALTSVSPCAGRSVPRHGPRTDRQVCRSLARGQQRHLEATEKGAPPAAPSFCGLRFLLHEKEQGLMPVPDERFTAARLRCRPLESAQARRKGRRHQAASCTSGSIRRYAGSLRLTSLVKRD